MFSRKTLVKKFHFFLRKVAKHGRKASPVQKNKVNAKVLWSELDENLLGEIMSRLCLTDQACFRAVCKRWSSVRPITTYAWLPWFVSIENYPSIWSNSVKYRLHEPYSSPRSRISTHKISFSKLSIPYSLPLVITVQVRHNWLLISVCLRSWPRATTHNYFSLFSLLTRTYVQLPKLDKPMSSNFIYTFSKNPDSPDCVFLISNIENGPEFFVMTCYQGDKEWTLRKFDNLASGLCLAEYINGAFFVVSPFGQMVSYNIMNGEFEIETLDRDEDLDLLSDSEMELLVFELNGELTILYIGFSYDYVRVHDTTFPGIPCIKKFDRATKAWYPLRSLGDQTLFVGHRICSIAKVGKEQARNMGVLSDVIYYYYDLGCIIYSFENGVLVQSEFNPASNQYDSAIKDTKNNYAWLEPCYMMK